MRKVVVAMVALALPFVGAGPASADPARASAASAFALSATGLLAIPPTPGPAVAQQPPDAPAQNLSGNVASTLPLAVPGIAVNGTLNAVAEATRASTIGSVVPGVDGNNNARGFARTEGLSVLGSADLLTVVGGNILALTDLVDATVVEAEAVARCVNNVPVFDAGVRLLGLEVGGQALDPLLQPVLDLLLGTLNLPGVVQIQRGDRDPSLTVRTADSITITALRISILGTTEVINVSTATASMPANCAVEQPAAAPTGPGPIAPTLAATGGSDLILPAAVGMLLTGFGLRRLNRRARRENAAA